MGVDLAPHSLVGLALQVGDVGMRAYNFFNLIKLIIVLI